MRDVKQPSLFKLRESLLKVIKLTGHTIESLPRPMYLATCDKQGIDGWTKDEIFDSGKCWKDLKKEAMDFGDRSQYFTNPLKQEVPDIVDLGFNMPLAQMAILNEYAQFIKENNYAPTLAKLKESISYGSKIKDYYKNSMELENDYKRYFPEEAQKYLLDKKSWTDEYKARFYEEFNNHKRFIFTSIGSFCKVDFNFLASLKEYADTNDAMIIGLPLFKRYEKSVSDYCVDPAVKDYGMWVIFEDIVLNNNLMVQVLKSNCTTKSTLTGLNQLVSKYGSSIIVAGINQQLKYIPVLKNRTPNMIASTGCCTEYESFIKDQVVKIPTRQEKLAQDRLSIKGGLVVELIDDELFTVRNIEADETGSFYDLGYLYTPNGTETAHEGSTFVIGDLHAPKHNEILLEANIRAIDRIGCDTIVLHDSVNMAYVSHHNADKAIVRAQMVEEGKANILNEIEAFADILAELASVPTVQKIIVPYSNHPSHLEQSIQDIGRMTKDDINLRTCLMVALAMLDNKNILKYLTEDVIGYKNDIIDWVDEDAGREIYGVQVGLHGSEKVNGGRLTPTSTNNAFPKTVLAHRHSAGIDGDTVTVGICCDKEQGYNKGLSSWTESSAIVYPNGKVQLLTFVNVKGDYKLWL